MNIVEPWFFAGQRGQVHRESREKNPHRTVEDLRKAAWYVKREIDRLAGEGTSGK